MKIVFPYHGGNHYHALGFWVAPKLTIRGHEVKFVTPSHIHHKTIGDSVEWCDVMVTSSPWWDYIGMWISAAKHFKKPWIYHPEGWDNVHPVLHEPGHQKNQGWPFAPDRFLAHGKAMERAFIKRKGFEFFSEFRITGSPRFDVYGKYMEEIATSNPFHEKYGIPDDGIPIVMVSTASLWNHRALIEKLRDNTDYYIAVSQHQYDHVEMYEDLKSERVFVYIPDGCDYDNPERDHGYTPGLSGAINYARQLYHADVVVNMAGTASLEAMMLETPVVNIRTPGPTGSEAEHSKSLSHYMPGAHYVDVRAGETSYLAATPEDVPDMVKEVIDVGRNVQRERAIHDMLGDVLSITFKNGIPSSDATSKVCDAIEEFV